MNGLTLIDLLTILLNANRMHISHFFLFCPTKVLGRFHNDMFTTSVLPIGWYPLFKSNFMKNSASTSTSSNFSRLGIENLYLIMILLIVLDTINTHPTVTIF